MRTKIVCFLILASLGSQAQGVTAQTKPKDPRNTDAFTRVSASVLESVRKNVIDKRVYSSPEGVLVEYYAELCNTADRANEALKSEEAKWKTCDEHEDVFNVRGSVVGKRTVCKMGISSFQAAIIYTYNDILTIISGRSLETLILFESQTCVRSKRVAGIPCKY